MKRMRVPFLPAIVALLAVLAAFPILTNNPSMREELFLVFMLVTLASSINIIMGYTGYVSFGHIVFFGLGGYFAFYLMQIQGWHFIPSLIVAAIPSAVIAALIGFPILRLRGAYFALATVGINEAMRVVFNNWDLFGGAVGMFFNFSVYTQYGGAKAASELAYYTMTVVAIATITVSYLIKRSKFFFKNGIIEPGHAFELLRSIESLVMVVLGGIGTVAGPIVGAAAYEWLRGFLITNPALANFQLFLAGLLLLVTVLFVSSGLVGWLRERFPVLRGYVP
ncbi:MAG: branched-chain amino acid ABC transporter permease [Chloroflexi bacterium]|nr:MAG: branched-chain amino acid ABC transporter permease [Chloroflexota bacterium]